MKHFVILLVVIFTGMIVAPMTIPQSFALCMVNEDWSDAPCWGRRCAGNEPACIDPNWWKERWAPYYEYKGKDWMEAKKQELLSAIESKTLADWLSLTVNSTNKNVHDYYHYMGEVPNRYGVKVSQAFAGWYPPLKQLNIGMSPNELFCRTDFSLIFKTDSSPACVSHDTHVKLYERGWTKLVPIYADVGKTGTYKLELDEKAFDVKYSVSGAMLESIEKDSEGHLNIIVGVFREGQLTITVPFDLIVDSSQDWDENYVVLVNGVEVAYDKKINVNEQTLKIPLASDSNLVQIIATRPISGDWK
ncbi:MAG: hypothetical protein KC444_05605 [Nitrosopumilus sp.]|nr:hypothetical protein [Nitrosopumilus sp.]